MLPIFLLSQPTRLNPHGENIIKDSMATLPPSSASPPSQLGGTPVNPTMPLPAEDLTSAAGASPARITGREVTDTGWDTNPKEVDHLVEGISNEEIWMLVRRLNKMVFHIKHASRVSPDGLDLAVAPDMEFSPNKFRSQLERFYMGVIVGTLAFVKHVSRLRSWNEKTRTGTFCAVSCSLGLCVMEPHANLGSSISFVGR